MKSFLDLPKDEWTATTYQLAILLANIYIIFQKSINVFVFYSTLLVVSIFAIQAVSRRFRLLHPHRGDFQVKVEFFDTHLLRFFIIMSAFLLLLGVINAEFIRVYEDNLPEFLYFADWVGDNPNLCFFVMYFFLPVIVFLLLLPFIWCTFFRDLIDKKIYKSLENKQSKIIDVCPSQESDTKHFSQVTIELVFLDDEGEEHQGYQEGLTPMKKMSWKCPQGHVVDDMYNKFRTIS